MSFVNTIAVVGDEALTNSIIERSITTIADNHIKVIGERAFEECSDLTSANFLAATNIGTAAFTNCFALTTINFPVATSLGSSAFSSCYALNIADFPAVTSIDGNAFRGCSKLSIADFPIATNIGDYAFYGCSALTRANFPMATSIGDSAFRNCYKRLKTADFPVATSIDNYAFLGCSVITALILRSETMAELINSNAFEDTPIASGTGYIYVPAELVDSYKAESNWSIYANQFRALESYTVDGTTTGELDSAKI